MSPSCHNPSSVCQYNTPLRIFSVYKAGKDRPDPTVTNHHVVVRWDQAKGDLYSSKRFWMYDSGESERHRASLFFFFFSLQRRAQFQPWSRRVKEAEGLGWVRLRKWKKVVERGGGRGEQGYINSSGEGR